MSFGRVDARSQPRPGRQVLSVGIDVGTTTTQVVFSRLTVADVARPQQVPRLEITDKSVLHLGQPRFTPLTAPDEVDARALADLVAAEYAQAGVDPADVETGAVIITGETARTHNAEEILRALASAAGDFIVTVAGPNAEARISGMGAGVARWSAANYTQVTTVDIGGGTSNAAMFVSGRHSASSAAAVGGRIIQIDTSGVVTAVAPPAAVLASATGIDIRVGKQLSLAELTTICDAMADRVLDLVLGVPVEDELQLTPALRGPASKTIFLSGGVGTCYYQDLPVGTIGDVARFGDLGPLLAARLRAHPRMAECEVLEPEQTIQATVLGAAGQTVTVSGSTIWKADSLLPLHNLPVLDPGPIAEITDFAGAVSDALRARELAPETLAAIVIDIPRGVDFDTIGRLADTIAAGRRADATSPLVLILEHDYGQVLGQAIHTRAENIPLLVVDQIGLGEGDFIDIGAALFGGRAVPISIKTLVFYD